MGIVGEVWQKQGGRLKKVPEHIFPVGHTKDMAKVIVVLIQFIMK